MYVWVGMIDDKIALESGGDEELYLAVTGGRCLLTGCDTLDRAGHINFEVHERRSAAVFVLVSASEAIFISDCSASHTAMHYPTA